MVYSDGSFDGTNDGNLDCEVSGEGDLLGISEGI